MPWVRLMFADLVTWHDKKSDWQQAGGRCLVSDKCEPLIKWFDYGECKLLIQRCRTIRFTREKVYPAGCWDPNSAEQQILQDWHPSSARVRLYDLTILMGVRSERPGPLDHIWAKVLQAAVQTLHVSKVGNK